MKTSFKSTFFILFTAILLISFASCEKVKELAKIDIVADIPPQTIVMQKAMKNGLAQQYYEFNVSVNLDSIQQAHNLSTFTLESGKVKEAMISITAPADFTYDFLTSSHLTLLTTGGTENLVAHTGNIASGSKTITYILDMADISQLIKAQSFHGRLYYDTEASLMPDTPVINQLDFKIEFTINPL